MNIKLSCVEGYKNEGWNRVKVEPQEEFQIPWPIELIVQWLKELNPDVPIYACSDCFFILGAESFSLSDLAETLQDIAHHNDIDWDFTYED